MTVYRHVSIGLKHRCMLVIYSNIHQGGKMYFQNESIIPFDCEKTVARDSLFGLWHEEQTYATHILSSTLNPQSYSVTHIESCVQEVRMK